MARPSLRHLPRKTTTTKTKRKPSCFKEISMGRYLEMINSPADVKLLTMEQLTTLAQEIRDELVTVLSKSGGHLGPNLGVVELTIAMHKVFESPKDRFVWDVSHQVYVHKLLTGRRQVFHKIRQTGGPMGFALREESPHDCFGAGHAGTALSAALGMAAVTCSFVLA